jgi:hypothetical protein
MQRSRRKGSRCKRNIQISLGFGLGLGFALGVAKTHGNTNEPTHPKSQPPAAAAMESQPGPRWEADPTRPFQSGSCMQSPTRRARKRNRGRGLGWVHAGRWDSLGIRVPGDQTSRARATRFTFPIPFPANEARLLTAVVLPPASGRGGTWKRGPWSKTRYWASPLPICCGPCVRRARTWEEDTRVHPIHDAVSGISKMNNSRPKK